jgi:hypothetical protein
MTLKLLAGSIALTLFLFACKKDDATPAYSPPDGSYKLVFEKVFKPSCALSNCHSKEGDFGHHGLGNDYTYDHLLTDPVENNEALAAGLRLIQPGSPDSSFLYAKIKWDGSAFQFGQKMPTGGLKLTANQIEFVRQWIAAGAPETGHVADRTLVE